MLQRIERFFTRASQQSVENTDRETAYKVLEPDKLRDIGLVRRYVHQLNRDLVVVEESNMYRQEGGGVAPLQVIVKNPDRIVATIVVATHLRADGTPPTGALFPVTLEKVKQLLETGWQRRKVLDEKHHISSF